MANKIPYEISISVIQSIAFQMMPEYSKTNFPSFWRMDQYEVILFFNYRLLTKPNRSDNY